MIPGGLTPIRLRPLTSALRLDPPTIAIGPPPCSTSILVFGVTTVLPSRERGWLGDVWRLGDSDRQRSIGHRHGRNLHVLANDDRPGPGVEDDARGHVRLDLQLPDLGHESGERDVARPEQFDPSAVDFICRMSTKPLPRISVDRVDNSHGGGVVRILQFQHRAQFVGEPGELVLDDCAVWNTAGRRDPLRQRLALPRGFEPGHRDRALRARVDRPIRRLKLGEQEGFRPSKRARRQGRRR